MPSCRVLSKLLVNITHPGKRVPPKPMNIRCHDTGSGTTSVNQSRLVISRCFECLEDLSHFLPPLIGVGAVHPAGRHL